MRHRSLVLATLLLSLSLGMAGCNAYSVATRASGVIGAILQVAAVEINTVPAQDQAAFTGFVNLGQSLKTQLDGCLTSANSANLAMLGKSGKFLACFNTFAQGLTSPQEIVALRILSPSTQNKVQLYLAGIVAGVNVAVSQFGGAAASAPLIPSATAPTAAELRQLGRDAHISDVEMAMAGL